LLIASFAVAILLGIGVGVALAATHNNSLQEQLTESNQPLPTRVLDINDNEITQLFSTQNREPISLSQVPQSLRDAVISKEDHNFYNHHGFDMRGLFRALFKTVTGQYVSGGSTITQELAGTLAQMRSVRTIRRKVKELWYAIQLERQFSKDEILEMYLNDMPFGAGNVGVQAASKFFFGHSVEQDTLAESAMLAIQLSTPSLNNPIRNPERAKALQLNTLHDMVRMGYATKQEADDSFKKYWASWDPTRANSSAFLDREDNAPFFSAYIRKQLDDILVGTNLDYLTDGLVVHTTLNLNYQKEADLRMTEDIDKVNAVYLKTTANTGSSSNSALLPLMDMLGYNFDMSDFMNRNKSTVGNAKRDYAKRLAPVVEMAATLFGLPKAQEIIAAGVDASVAQAGKTQVQGALISIDPSNGYILAMVGGRQYSRTNQFNRAVDSAVQPGSSFKPLYYSAAIDSRKFTAASMLMDQPIVFTNPDGTLYAPQDFKGEWHQRVLLRHALAESMNVPSLEILDGIGLDAGIQRAARLLGVTDSTDINRRFPHYLSIGLGTQPVAPLEMARAYSVFANGGREVDPVSIRFIEDKQGKVIKEPARETMNQVTAKGDAAQIMSPQTAYIMTSILQSTFREGTLSGEAANTLDLWSGKGQPFAAKTGTSQNWEDAWTIGFSPYVCTAVWYGFDSGNQSLGLSLTGAYSAGPTWARYMKSIHTGLPIRPFTRPSSGLVDRVVSATSGLLPTDHTKSTINEIFLAGTEPTTFDQIDEDTDTQTADQVQSLMNEFATPSVPDSTDTTTSTTPDTGGAATGTSSGGNPLLE